MNAWPNNALKRTLGTYGVGDRGMQWLFRLVLVSVALLGSSARAAESGANQFWSLVLRYPHVTALGAADTERLKDKAVEILSSSNFNSAASLQEQDESTTNLQYADAVSGSHMLVTFVSPETIETVGGKIVVKEIVIGLNGPHYANSLHTIDDKGRVVGHGKFSGVSCVELLEMVKALPNNRLERTPGSEAPLPGVSRGAVQPERWAVQA